MTTFRDETWDHEVEITLTKDDANNHIARWIVSRLPEPLSLAGYRCDSITVRPRGEPLTSSVLHQIPTSRLIKSALLSTVEITTPEDARHGFSPVPARWLRRDPKADAEALRLLRKPARAAKKRGRKHYITEDDLPEVAQIYRANVATKGTRQAICDHFHVSPATAARAIERARKAGHLRPAIPGRAGEAPEPEKSRRRPRTNQNK
jgi:hypothetical protein